MGTALEVGDLDAGGGGGEGRWNKTRRIGEGPVLKLFYIHQLAHRNL